MSCATKWSIQGAPRSTPTSELRTTARISASGRPRRSARKAGVAITTSPRWFGRTTDIFSLLSDTYWDRAAPSLSS
jgi:hypothetical protein